MKMRMVRRQRIVTASDFAAIRQIIPTKSSLEVLASTLKTGFLTSSRDNIAVRYLPKNEEFMAHPLEAEVYRRARSFAAAKTR
jgi:hypothetical protein